MSMNLYDASSQWSSRPADQRFWGIHDAYRQARSYAESCSISDPLQLQQLRTQAIGKELCLVGPQGIPVRLSHLGFGQLANLAKFPGQPLRALPPTLAAQVLNHKLATVRAEDSTPLSLLLYKQHDTRNAMHLAASEYLVSAITTTDYSRVWNYEILERCQLLVDQGWKVPPARSNGDPNLPTRAAITTDVLAHIGAGGGQLVKVGDEIAPSGVYVWQGGMFVLMVEDKHVIDDGTGPLFRGVIVENAETGTKSFRIRTFWLRGVCGNHILWGVEKVTEWTVRHIGEAREKAWSITARAIGKAVESASSLTEQVIKKARTLEIAATKDEVLDTLFGQRIGGKRALEAGYLSCEQHEPALSPRSYWGMVQGLTRASQASQYAEQRMELDRAAGLLMKRVAI